MSYLEELEKVIAELHNLTHEKVDVVRHDYNNDRVKGNAIKALPKEEVVKRVKKLFKLHNVSKEILPVVALIEKLKESVTEQYEESKRVMCRYATITERLSDVISKFKTFTPEGMKKGEIRSEIIRKTREKSARSKLPVQ